MLYGSEVRTFTDQTVNKYEIAHRNMAKTIQHLPKSTPNNACIESLGWCNIRSYVDYKKLMYVWHLLSLGYNNIYRIIFIFRLSKLLEDDNYGLSNSIVSQFIKTCIKYSLLEIVKDIAFNVDYPFPSKTLWKKMCNERIKQSTFVYWRFNLRFYTKLTIYRVVHSNIKPLCWWNIEKLSSSLFYKVRIIIRLLVGCNALDVYSKTSIPREQRICLLCNSGAIEDTAHFVMYCTFNRVPRKLLYEKIKSLVTGDVFIQFTSLSYTMQLYILLGMEYPFSSDSLQAIRISSCRYITWMYKRRNSKLYDVT